MKHTSITLLTLTAAASIAQAAPAAAPAFTSSGNLAITSDYVWRGLSQTGGKAAIQGGYDVSHSSGLSAGVWASNVSSATGELEIDVYGNYGFKLGAFDASIGYLNYTYNTAQNFSEANVSLAYNGLTLKYSFAVNDTYNLGDYYEINYSYDVASVKGLNLGLHYGQWVDADYDYAIALSYPVLGFTASVTYSDLQNGASITAFSLKKTF